MSLPAESLRGKTFVVTGANQGIGFQAAAAFAQAGADLVIVCRSREKAEPAREALQATQGVGSVRLVLADVSLKADCARACAEILATTPRSPPGGTRQNLLVRPVIPKRGCTCS